ncbi:cora-domain-containing protein [Hortaea werneckii]|nr:cora-domain-containing protein [Hortaea werneckii]
MRGEFPVMESVETHDFLTAFAYSPEHVTARFSSGQFAFGLAGAHVTLVRWLRTTFLFRCGGLVLAALATGVLSLFAVHGDRVGRVLVHIENVVVNVVNLLLNLADQGRIYICHVINHCVADPVCGRAHVVVKLPNSSPHVGRMRRHRLMERQNTIPKYDDVDVYRLHVIFAVLVLLERAVVDEVVVLEELHLLPLFFHQDVLSRELVNTEYACQYLHLILSRAAGCAAAITLARGVVASGQSKAAARWAGDDDPWQGGTESHRFHPLPLRRQIHLR